LPFKLSKEIKRLFCISLIDSKAISHQNQSIKVEESF